MNTSIWAPEYQLSYLNMAASLEAQIEEILTRHGLRQEDLRQTCSQAIRYEIAIKITDWQTLGHYFNIPDETLVAISVDHRTEEQRRIALLCTWHQQEGQEATYHKLIIALFNRQRLDLVDQVCILLKCHTATTTSSNGQELRNGSGWF